MTTTADGTAVLRLPPPREVTARALVRGLASAERLIGPASLLLVSAVVLEGGARRNDLSSVLPLLAVVAIPFLTSLILAWRPTRVVAVAHLAVGVLTGTVFAALVASRAPAEALTAYATESIASSLLFIGAVVPRAVSGVLWTLGGWIAGSASLVAGTAFAGEAYVLSWDRVTDAAIITFAYVIIAVGWRRRRSRMPVLTDLAHSSRDTQEKRARDSAATAITHDTVLAALTLVSRSPAELDDRLRDRIVRDIAAVGTATVSARGTAPHLTTREPLGVRVLGLVDEVRWRGLRVDVAGADSPLGDPGEDIVEALLGATSAALDNIVVHAGAPHADVTLGSSARRITIMIVDGGAGFDTATVSPDRLGLRESVVGRLERVGGTARIWSSAAGTTVLLSVPLTMPGDRGEQ